MTFFEQVALPLVEKGFHCFPVIPRSKRPVAMQEDADHFDASTTDPAQIRSWSSQQPNANVGLAPDEIFCFLETDDWAALQDACKDLPPEIWDTMQVGARANRCYFVFRQTARTRKVGNMTKTREDKENLFEFKQHRVYVVGPGSIHPTGAVYEILQDVPVIAMSDVLLERLCQLAEKDSIKNHAEMSPETARETRKLDRFLAAYEVATLGEWFNKGKQWYRPIECPWRDVHENPHEGDSTCIVYTEGGGYGFDCKHRCNNKDWHAFRAELERRKPDRNFSFVADEAGPPESCDKGDTPELTNEQRDWRSLFHTLEDLANAKPISFLIKGFLQREGVCALAAPARERKSLIALNVAHALLTGERLFDYFEVVQKPTRVLYLCPEVSIGPFSDRLKRLGLMDFVGKTLFCRTLSAEGHLELSDPLLQEALPGSVVILDTAVRFMKGDENSSEDCRIFADGIFALLRSGAESVLMLHHSPKDTGDMMTLENAMRGSGDLIAFICSCWGTRLQDIDNPYKCASFLSNLKQRDYESKNFEVTCDENCRMHIVGDPEVSPATLAPRRRGNKANKDGMDAAAIAVIKANSKLSVRKTVELLKENGIKRGKDWVQTKRYELLQQNGGLMP